MRGTSKYCTHYFVACTKKADPPSFFHQRAPSKNLLPVAWLVASYCSSTSVILLCRVAVLEVATVHVLYIMYSNGSSSSTKRLLFACSMMNNL